MKYESDKNVSELARKRQIELTWLILVIGLIIHILFVIINFFTGKRIIAAFDLVSVALIIPAIFIVKKGENIEKIGYVIIWYFCIFLTIIGFLSPHHTFYMWSVAITATGLNILGNRKGVFIVGIFNMLMLSIFLFRFSTGSGKLPVGAISNIILISILVFFVTYFSETTKKKYEAALIKANKELDRLSNVDSLTQLFNRRYFDNRLNAEWHRMQRDSKPLSMLLCDIDHFKEYNDTSGHQSGDECLRKIAEIIKKSSSRPDDVHARYGGEEFIVILPQCTSDGALLIAGRIQKSLSEIKILHPAFDEKIVTISIGVSTVVPDQSLAPEVLISLADEALYKSKKAGRNKISVLNYSDHFHSERNFCPTAG
ncbi:MAG: GGDEF domain-containing protein [Spirochaetes bacterium]|nr:GGDEF domain-containing protein [Spirochaetota bacterium]